MDGIKLDCPEASKYLLEYLTGRLDGRPEAETFEAHAHDCEICQSLVKDKRRALSAVIAGMSGKPSDAAGEVKAPRGFKLVIPTHQTKALVLGLVGVVGLLAISYVIRPGSEIMGSKIGDTMTTASTNAPISATKSPAKSEVSETTHSIKAATDIKNPAPEIAKTQPPAQPKESADPAKTITVPAKQPVATTNQPTSKHTASARKPGRSYRRVRRYVRPQKEQSRVEIFDEDGKKIGETTQPGGN